MNRCIIATIAAMLAASVFAADKASALKDITIKVVDEAGAPLANTQCAVVIELPTAAGSFAPKTDADGCLTFPDNADRLPARVHVAVAGCDVATTPVLDGSEKDVSVRVMKSASPKGFEYIVPVDVLDENRAVTKRYTNCTQEHPFTGCKDGEPNHDIKPVWNPNVQFDSHPVFKGIEQNNGN